MNLDRDLPPVHPCHHVYYSGHDMDTRFLLLPLKADQSDDGHAEVLREWTRDGFTTPPAWYHLSAYTATDQILVLLRERINDQDATMMLCRGVFWHVSRDYLAEVARQLREGQRQAFAFSTSENRYRAYPVHYTRITRVDDDGEWHPEEPVLSPPPKPAAPKK